MQPEGIVPAFDEAEDGHAGLGLGREATSGQQLAVASAKVVDFQVGAEVVIGAGG